MIIGNKIDLTDARQIKADLGQRLAESVGAFYGEVSAKEGIRVNEASHVTVT